MNNLINALWLSFYIFTFSSNTTNAMEPTFQFNYNNTNIDASLDSVGAFNGTIVNISSYAINMVVKRMINDIPESWSSSICIGNTCYNESVDSVNIQLSIEDSISCGLLAWTNGAGQGLVQLNIYDNNNLNENIMVDVNFFFNTYNSTNEQNNESNSQQTFTLIGNYPNPFNPVTTLIYELHTDAKVNITIYDILGNQVKTLINNVQNRGHKSIQWNTSNNYGRKVETGIYFYKIQTSEYQQVEKMIFLK